MLTLFGKFCRKLRIDNGELLKDMADKLNVTASYLSAVENGKRNVPQDWLNKIAGFYGLNNVQFDELRDAVEESQLNNKISLKGFNKEDRDIVLALARKIEGMNDEEKAVLKNLFKK